MPIDKTMTIHLRAFVAISVVLGSEAMAKLDNIAQRVRIIEHVHSGSVPPPDHSQLIRWMLKGLLEGDGQLMAAAYWEDMNQGSRI